ncbi:hypothetical protein BC941DRAFT_413043 [Chlamydoabsidia padenii]|nr:hypothetical protein BC941DRAFT_413043 [Chlamydoabsidia padenii]
MFIGYRMLVILLNAVKSSGGGFDFCETRSADKSKYRLSSFFLYWCRLLLPSIYPSIYPSIHPSIHVPYTRIPSILLFACSI